MKRYIQRKGQSLETVDEFDSEDFSNARQFFTYVREMLSEYKLSDSSAHYYQSARACKGYQTGEQHG